MRASSRIFVVAVICLLATVLMAQTRASRKAGSKHSHAAPAAAKPTTAEAQKFIDWVTSPEGQSTIASYRIGGEQVFFPNANANAR